MLPYLEATLDEIRRTGLADLAGGWAGSDELAEDVENLRAGRGPTRSKT